MPLWCLKTRRQLEVKAFKNSYPDHSPRWLATVLHPSGYWFSCKTGMNSRPCLVKPCWRLLTFWPLVLLFTEHFWTYQVFYGGLPRCWQTQDQRVSSHRSSQLSTPQSGLRRQRKTMWSSRRSSHTQIHLGRVDRWLQCQHTCAKLCLHTPTVMLGIATVISWTRNCAITLLAARWSPHCEKEVIRTLPAVCFFFPSSALNYTFQHL